MLNSSPIFNALYFTIFKNLFYPTFCSKHEFFCIAYVNEATRYEVWTSYDCTRSFIHRHYNDNHAFLCQLLTVTNNDVTYIANAKAINEDSTSLYTATFTATIFIEFKDLTIVADKNFLRIYAHSNAKFTMTAQHTVLTMNRNEVFWANKVKHCFKLFLARMTRYVDTTIFTIYNVTT